MANRLIPECFIEVFKHGEGNLIQYLFYVTEEYNLTNCSDFVVAVFLIKSQETTLAERLEARKLNL
jgi:hypothetical protein